MKTNSKVGLTCLINTFPPSINRLYFSLPRGGKAMTKEGVRFKNLITQKFQQEWGPELHLLSSEKPYAVEFTFYFDTVFNKGWPGKAQQRFKKRDATNLIKLLEDTLSKAIGVDDANFTQVTVRKKVASDKPCIVIHLTELTDDDI